jgi:spermidine synthase/MFS family permease
VSDVEAEPIPPSLSDAPLPAAPPTRPPVALLAVLFFMSGGSGLVYQVAWSKRLELTFGTTSYSIGTILAAYMAGLGLGAWLFGRLADRPGSPARRYAALEAGIGIYALFAPWVLDLVEAVYVGLGGAGGMVLKTALGFMAIVPATLLMGGTLPVLARSLVSQRGDTQRAVGLLYGLNTLGAVAGATLAGMFLVHTYGMDQVSRATGVFNLLLAAVAFALGTRLAPDVTASLDEEVASPPPDSERSRQLRLQLALAATFGCGLVALSLEVAWTRALSLAFGSTGHGFTIMLAATLLGIGGGSLVVARAAPDERTPLGQLALSFLLLGGSCYAFFSGFELLPRLFFVVAQSQSLYYEQFLGFFFAISTAVLLPATIALGIAFPLCTQLGTRAAGDAGAVVGRLYLSNTCGAILGSMLGAFVFVPLLGTDGVIRWGAAIASLAGAGIGWQCAEHGGWPRTRARLVTGLGIVLALGVLAKPAWDPSSLDMAPTRQRVSIPRQPGAYQRMFDRGGFTLRYAKEGRNAYVSVRSSSRATTMLLGGKPDASTVGDMPTQLMCGVVPFMARPHAKRALVVGAGSGVTTRVVAGFPGVEHVDLVEIEEAMVEAAAEYFAEVNHGVFEWDNVTVTYDDARTFLLCHQPEDYDVIVSVPTNPSIAGVANLFTQEHYENAKRCLRPGGVYMQWIQLYESNDWMARAMLRTFVDSFEHVDMWWANPMDLLLIGSDQDFVYDLEAAAAAVSGNEHLARDLWPFLHCRSPQDVFGRYLTTDATLRFVSQGAELLHDRFPRLEGRAAEARYMASAPYTLREELFSELQYRGSAWPKTTAPPPPEGPIKLATARFMVGQWPGPALAQIADLELPEAVALRAKTSPPGAEDQLQAALAKAPDDVHLLLALAQQRSSRGDMAGTRELLDRLEAQAEDAALPASYYALRARQIVPDTPARARALTWVCETGLAALLPRDSDMAIQSGLLFRLADAAALDARALAVLSDRWEARPWAEEVGLALAQAYLGARRPSDALIVLDVLTAESHMDSVEFARRLRLRALDALGDREALAAELTRFLRDFPLEGANPLLFPMVQKTRPREDPR